MTTTEPAPFYPRVVALGVDPSSGSSTDSTGLSVLLADCDGHYRALSVSKAKFNFHQQLKVIGARLAEITEAYPRCPVVLVLDASGTQGSMALSCQQMIEERYGKHGRVSLVGLTVTGGEGGLGRKMTRVQAKDAPEWAYSMARGAVINQLVRDLHTGDLDLSDLPEADKAILTPELAGWRVKGKRVEHGKAGDDAAFSLALARAGADKACGSLSTATAPSQLRGRFGRRAALHKDAVPLADIYAAGGFEASTFVASYAEQMAAMYGTPGSVGSTDVEPEAPVEYLRDAAGAIVSRPRVVTSTPDRPLRLDDGTVRFVDDAQNPTELTKRRPFDPFYLGRPDVRRALNS